MCPVRNRHYCSRIHTWKHAHQRSLSFFNGIRMNLSLQEVNHILTALEKLSSYDVARAREMISEGVTDHDQLVQKLKDYKLRLSGPAYDAWSFE